MELHTANVRWVKHFHTHRVEQTPFFSSEQCRPGVCRAPFARRAFKSTRCKSHKIYRGLMSSQEFQSHHLVRVIITENPNGVMMKVQVSMY